MKKKLKDLALFLEQLRSHFICIDYVQIDNVEEQRKIKEDLIQNTEEVEKVLAIREDGCQAGIEIKLRKTVSGNNFWC